MGIPGRIATLLLASLILRTPAAAQEISVIELRHRPAEELVPLLQPLLGPGEVLVPNRNQLILRAGPETVRDIRTLLEQIDQKPRRLLITVTQSSTLGGKSGGAGARIRGRIDPNQPDRSGVEIRGGTYRSQDMDQTGTTQQVQTLDGQAAMIQIGARVPIPNGWGGVQHQPVTTGFAVTPRLTGDRVVLDIEPWSDRLGRGMGNAIETRSARTQVTATLGEWIEIGGVVESESREHHGLTGSGYLEASRDSRFFIKIEDLDAGTP